MCGIIGYSGRKGARGELLNGLRRLEYRGYDSAGIAVLHQGLIRVVKYPGRIGGLEARVAESPPPGTAGIGHTRWATHGAANDENAHPHLGGSGELALAHNGVIENYQDIRRRTESAGAVFKSQTDSEAVAHLLAQRLAAVNAPHLTEASLEEAAEAAIPPIEEALGELRGSYGLAVLLQHLPGTIVAARLGSPLVIGIGDGCHYLASDPIAFPKAVRRIVYLNDREIAFISQDELHLHRRGSGTVLPKFQTLEHRNGGRELGGYRHYMQKEIFEQPESAANAMRGRIHRDEATAHFGGLNLTPQQTRNIGRIILTGCGTSWHSALIGEYLIEELARIPVEVEYASEFRYRNAPMDRDSLVIAITQSGETADTLAALLESKRRGCHALGICNVIGSTIARESDGGIYLYAGPEIGVASTKAFTSQVTVLLLLALHLGRMRHLSYQRGLEIIEEIERLPGLMRKTLETGGHIHDIAMKYAHVNNMLYLGRHYNFPAALEGALKLKEVSYIHAEGYPAAEMKHGPIALVDPFTPTVFIAPRDAIHSKVMSNLEEVKARGGPVLAIATEGDDEIAAKADDVIYIPQTSDYLQPLLTVLPLQLLAYHIAVIRGCDVDKPRNLAKSVTVE